MVLLGMSILMWLLAPTFIAFGALMIMVVLIQRPKGGGLAGAFGGSSTDVASAFGASVGDLLTWVTVSFFVVWVCLAIGMQWAIAGEIEQASLLRQDSQPVETAPATAPAEDATTEPADATPTAP